MNKNTETSVPQGTANDVPAGSSPSFNLLPASDNVYDDDCCEHCDETESQCECLECDDCGEKKIDEHGEHYFHCGECARVFCEDCCDEWDGDWKEDYPDMCAECKKEEEDDDEEEVPVFDDEQVKEWEDSGREDGFEAVDDNGDVWTYDAKFDKWFKNDD